MVSIQYNSTQKAYNQRSVTVGNDFSVKIVFSVM